MNHMIDAEKVVSYLRDEVHAGKAAAVVEKYASKHAVLAAPVGEKISLDGYGITLHRDGAFSTAQIEIIKKEKKQ